MKLGLFSQPFHPTEKAISVGLEEDYQAALHADYLGFEEVFFGEHITDPFETITSCTSFLSTLIYTTKNIKLGTGTINLPNSHPVQVASTIAMMDHMSRGRLIMGISMGALRTDWEAFGVLDSNKQEMFVEAIGHIISLWNNEAPYDLTGKFWNISTAKTMDNELRSGHIIKPYQQGGPEIVCSALDPYSKGLIKAAERGWSPMSSNFLAADSLKNHWKNYTIGCHNKGIEPELKKWRVARMIFVSDSEHDVQKYAKHENGPYAKCIEHILKKLRKANKLGVFKETLSQPDSDITLDYCLNKLVIAGSPNDVAEQLQSLREKVGNFETLLYVGVDWQNAELARRSMELLATKVSPILNP